LQQIQQDNAQLRQRLAVEARRRLDSQVATAVPNYQQVDQDPRWHRWLLGIDNLSGRIRQHLLNESIASGDTNRVVSFFREFEREAGGAQPSASTRATSRGARSPQIYTREMIRQLYERHRKGEFAEAAWAKIEADIFAAQHENRIQAAPYLTK
jgi:hypothetical protein